MALPLATTTIAVLRSAPADEYAEPYSGAPERSTVASGVPAVIDTPVGRTAGREYVAGGEQTTTELRLLCDRTELSRLDHIRDERTDQVYRLEWFVDFPGSAPGDDGHVEGGLSMVEGLI